MSFSAPYRLLAAGFIAMSMTTAALAGSLPRPPHETKEKPMSGLSFSRPLVARVEPVTIGAVRYEPTIQTTTPGPEHAPGVLGAYDASTGVRLWTLKVSAPVVDQRLESDTQEDHIRTLTVSPDGKLQIVTETGRRYEVDPVTRCVRSLP